jgi:hypothetical protein
MEVAIKGLKSLLMVTFLWCFCEAPNELQKYVFIFFHQNSCVEYILGLKICER